LGGGECTWGRKLHILGDLIGKRLGMTQPELRLYPKMVRKEGKMGGGKERAYRELGCIAKRHYVFGRVRGAIY